MPWILSWCNFSYSISSYKNRSMYWLYRAKHIQVWFDIPDKFWYYTYRCMKFRSIFNFDFVPEDRLKVNCSLKLYFKDGRVLCVLRLSFFNLLALWRGVSFIRVIRRFCNNYLLVLLLMCSRRKKLSLVQLGHRMRHRRGHRIWSELQI